MADIVRSMVVIALIVLAVWGIGKFFTVDGGDPVKPIDYVQVVDQARPAATFDLVAPSSIPEGWRATSARFEPNSWHLGVLTDDDEYIGLEQVKVSVDRAVDRYADGSKLKGETTVAGDAWTVRTGPDGRLTYVRRAGGLTTLVNGTAPRDDIEAYVASLS
jgi:hypothetical protein